VTQLLGLLAIAPLLLALGSPASLLSRAAPVRVGRPLRRLLDVPVLRPLTYPIIGALLIAAVPLVVYFTRLGSDLAGDPGRRQLFQLLLLVIGLLAAYPLGEGDLKPPSFSYPLAMFAAFVELIIDSGPGILLRYRGGLIEDGFWAARSRAAGYAPLDDQHHAGAVLWFVGEAWDLPVLAVLFVAWMRADRRQAADIDAALDAESRSGATTFDPDGMIRPWWLPTTPAGTARGPAGSLQDVDRSGDDEGDRDQ
jgi:putative membrane protein